ncbi:23545_t:CDS:2 [Entrophospora sp. SA101]|nr:23545_t:CDS:2 [Entrophospora sp. SA101]
MTTVYINNPAKTLEEVDKEEHFLASEVSTKIGFLKRLSSLIPNMLTTAKQGEEQLKQVKNLSEEDKQKLLELGQKEQEN